MLANPGRSFPISHLASFRTLLRTGHLGPLNPAQNLSDVSALMGPPHWWDFPSDLGYPLYWGYDSKNGSTLEISFLENPPHAMHWFQIEHASHIRSKVEVFGPNLSLATEGLKGSTAPSQFIQSNIWDMGSVTVHLTVNGLDLAMIAGTVVLHFYLPNEHTRMLGDARMAAYANAFGSDPSFGDINRLYRVDSIYSHPNTIDAQNTGIAFDLRCTGEQYLRSLRTT